MVIHHMKNYWLYKDATCHNLWPCDFTDVTAFSSLFFLALHYCFFLYISFLLWLLLWVLNVYQVIFHGCSFLGAPFSPNVAFSGCFFGLFCPVLGGCFLALCRSLISSDWFFVWHSLRPSSTQLLVRNHSGFSSHWYLAGLLFLLSTSFLQVVLQSSTLLFF